MSITATGHMGQVCPYLLLYARIRERFGTKCPMCPAPSTTCNGVGSFSGGAAGGHTDPGPNVTPKFSVSILERVES